MKQIIHWSMTLVATLLLIVGLLLVVLPGPAVVVLPLAIWLFNKYQPGKLDPYVRRFMRFNQRMAARLDRFFKPS